MPHLAAVTGFRLAVKVKFHTRNSEHRIPVRLLQSISRFPGISENIQHYGRGKQRGVAERESRHRANLLLKLARHAGFDRRVTGVMRTRSGLIGDNRTVFKNEEFDAELQKMADMYKMEIEKIKEFMQDAEAKQMKDDIAIQKAVELIVSSAVEK